MSADYGGGATEQAVSLFGEFQRTGNLNLLNRAIDLLGQEVDATPIEDPDRARVLSNLAVGLYTRFERTGQDDDLVRQPPIAS